MINLVEQDITEQPEDIMQIDQQEISSDDKKESKNQQIRFRINKTRTRKKEIDRQDDNSDSQGDK